jgi:(p)ppGpp synthase/HD superfamily hydrolase
MHTDSRACAWSHLHRNTLRAWLTLLEQTRNQAKIRATFADKLRDQLTTPMKPYIADKGRLFAKVPRATHPRRRAHSRTQARRTLTAVAAGAVTQYTEYAQRVQTDLHVGFGELARVSSSVPHAHRETQRERTETHTGRQAHTHTHTCYHIPNHGTEARAGQGPVLTRPLWAACLR